MRAFLALAVAAALVLAAPARPSWALAGVEKVMVLSDSDSRNKLLTAECPTGKKVVGGNARISGAGEMYAHLTSLVPIPDNAFQAQAEEYRIGTSLNWELTVWAVCAYPPPELSYHVAVSAFDTTPTKSITAACPAKTLIGLGAGAAFGNGRVLLRDMVRGYDGRSITVRATADRHGWPSDWFLGAHLICATVDVEAVESFSAFSTQNPKAAAAWCTGAWPVNSAGFTILDDSDTVGLNDVMTQLGTQGGATAYQFPLGQPAGGLWSIGVQTLCTG